LTLTGIGPLLSWRKSTGATIAQQFLKPAIAGLLAAVGFSFLTGALYEKSSATAIATMAICVFVFSTIVQEFVRGTRQRMRNSGENVFDALLTLVLRARRRYGGYVVHFGVVLMFLGFAGNAFKLEKSATLAPNETTEIGRYRVRFDGLSFEDD